VQQATLRLLFNEIILTSPVLLTKKYFLIKHRQLKMNLTKTSQKQS